MRMSWEKIRRTEEGGEDAGVIPLEAMGVVGLLLPLHYQPREIGLWDLNTKDPTSAHPR